MDCVLQLIVPGNAPMDRVLAAVEGGVDLVQLREKGVGTERRVALFGELARHLRRIGVRTIVNDDVEAARRLELDGVHLGQEDDTPASARARLGPDAWIGLSTHGESEIRAAGPEVGHFGLGACFASRTKSDTVPLDPEELRRALAAAPRPVFAIGGIDEHRLPTLLERGVRRIAVSAAVLGAACPERAARGLRRMLDAVRDR